MNINEKIKQPSKFYNTPMNIVSIKDLNHIQKMKALKNWRQTCIQLQLSTSEGMGIHNNPPNDSEDLVIIANAMEQLQKQNKN